MMSQAAPVYIKSRAAFCDITDSQTDTCEMDVGTLQEMFLGLRQRSKQNRRSVRFLNRLGFQMTKTLGVGTYSVVKLANSEGNPDLSPVAIKIINGKNVSPNFVLNFLPRELDIIQRVSHPHIVHVHKVLQVPKGGQVCIVMEPAQTDVAKVIRRHGPISVQQARAWFSQTVSAVAYLHELEDIAHRDLKCENLLLTTDGQIKLTDFGFSRFVGGELSKTLCGTEVYLAPEVLNITIYDPKKSDVWSLGVILYIMLTGQLPSRGIKPVKLMNKSVRFPNNSKVDESSRAFLSFLLQFHPADRPSVTGVAQHPWLQSSVPSSSLLFTQTDAAAPADVSIAASEASSAAAGAAAPPVSKVLRERDFARLNHMPEPHSAVTKPMKACAKAPRSLRARMKRFFRRRFCKVRIEAIATQQPRQGACPSASAAAPCPAASEHVRCEQKMRPRFPQKFLQHFIKRKKRKKIPT